MKGTKSKTSISFFQRNSVQSRVFMGYTLMLLSINWLFVAHYARRNLLSPKPATAPDAQDQAVRAQFTRNLIAAVSS